MLDLKNISEKPGCYLYLNKDNKIIYVGKAKNLRKRVSQYFLKSQNYKTSKLVSEINDVKTIICNSEKEALLLEETLIKTHKPRYNIVLNDDKSYPYISITKSVDPQFEYHRNYKQKKYLATFGPFPEGTSARKILYIIQSIYPLKRCKGKMNNPCIYFHIDQCLGGCFKEIPKEVYDNQIKNIKSFFKGNTENVEKILVERMEKASNNLQFEQAQKIKEMLGHIDFFVQKQNVLLNEKKDRHVINFFANETHIVFTILFYVGGKFQHTFQESFELNDQDINDAFESFVTQFYSKNIIPDIVTIPNEFISEAMTELFKLNNKISSVEKQLLTLAKTNSEEFYNSNKESINQSILEEFRVLIGMEKYPHTIEVFDIANLSNDVVLGAMVVFKNNNPSKKDFRKWNIDIEEKGDYNRMKEVLYRRYQQKVFNNTEMPDLIIVDGGIIQLNAAKQILKELELDIFVVGLQKNKNHRTDSVVISEDKVIKLNSKTNLYKMLYSLQERVHNFAITNYRNKHEKKIFE
ncbi:excinuclease ABC subunit UvrC [Spiroplasma endosymbiont of Othius punctulatus]|uniref:excinuclease ABC subunit UvrC n=1 Tax=Spiroplasma endosymbiont of Othius punctulatus TaxID=3066289 RepID=UPI0030D32CEE